MYILNIHICMKLKSCIWTSYYVCCRDDQWSWIGWWTTFRMSLNADRKQHVRYGVVSTPSTTCIWIANDPRHDNWLPLSSLSDILQDSKTHIEVSFSSKSKQNPTRLAPIYSWKIKVSMCKVEVGWRHGVSP